MFGDSDKVGIDVVPLHGRPQSCMPNPLEGLLEVHEKHRRGLAGAKNIFSQRILRLKICSVVLLPAVKPACSSAMILSACGFNMCGVILSMTLL